MLSKTLTLRRFIAAGSSSRPAFGRKRDYLTAPRKQRSIRSSAGLTATLPVRAGKSIVEAGPGQKLANLYRARVFQSIEKLVESLKRPDLSLGAPPSNLAAAGRMNARGIAVFYGATHEDVAIAETRPPVGSHVAVGRFNIIGSLKLLDVEALQAILVKGSIFDPSHLERLKKASFLSHLSKQITLPVMPDDEPFEYLVTQAIADYLANSREPQLDGLIYRSVQEGKGRGNVVLFHKSARVKPLDIPPGTDISAHATSHSEDSSEPDFWVFESVPAPSAGDDKELDFPFFDVMDEETRIRNDHRSPTLRIDTDAISVHRIERATYTSEMFNVKRHRSIRNSVIKRVRRLS
jgi:RES domain